MKPLNIILFLLLIIWLPAMEEALPDLPGTWEVLVQNARIASMHTVVTRFNTVVLLDRTDLSPTEHGYRRYHCHIDPQNPTDPEPRSPADCFAYSAVYDLVNPYPRPLTIFTDTWCSSGQFLPNGTLLQTGGDSDGFKKIRMFTPCEMTSSCDWEELEDYGLAEGRWYSTNQILPNGSVIIVGGKAAVSVELFPPGGGVVNFPFLADAADDQMDNLYPYVHLLPNGHLFVFANNKSVLYDHTNNVVLKQYPELEGGPRNYPSAGSSAMLALTGDYSSATIVVCGGAQYGAYNAMNTNAPATTTCGRIEPTGKNPVWEMEDMPFPRIMGDMVMLPTGEILIINGAQAGSQGFEMATKPCLHPVLYKPDEPVGSRFEVLNPSKVPRLYHSTANLLPDGRVLLAGSNPHSYYNFSVEFPTELQIEAFSPGYLNNNKLITRPRIIGLPETVHYGDGFYILVAGEIPVMGVLPEVNIASAPYATHSFSQGQRLVKLDASVAWSSRLGSYKLACKAPPDGRVAPPGYYMVFVVYRGVPSVAKWVQLL